MNDKMIRFIISWVLKLEAILMMLPVLIALLYQEKEGFVYLFWAIVCAGIGFLICRKKPVDMEIYSRDGFVAVSLSWLVLGIFGAVPFVITREIPFYIDALFEIVSGFTTTGASILNDIEALSHASLFWRSFSHWVGGMGVLVFILALLPMKGGSVMNLMKAESPGPSVSKFVPRVRGTAKLLYQIYIVLTVATMAALMLSGISAFEAVTLAFGAAGTGGFAVLNSGCVGYSPVQQWILTIAMIAFGVNFNFYYLMLCKKVKSAFQSQEVKAYFLIILMSIGVITWNIHNLYPTIGEALRHAAFQVGSIITTTGFATADFNLWPELSRTILVMLMFVGACAGSTGGGIKVSRILILLKTVHKELTAIVHPRSVKRIRFDDHAVEHEVLRAINVFIIVYLVIFAGSMLVISFDEFSFETNFTAIAATLNNIGPGLDMVGPMGNYSAYSPISKLVLIFDMLAGRLELFPMLILFYPSTWKRRG
ncbi:MAG: TrkH family potassium uptake protein [Fusicatenibacter sp.]|nr:TrkH family potassium uptake protein [Lachnospiraceae bacterium]MDY2937585.1 TrkH family potassium uptake protein [Fusicatenibacter sp.]